MSATISSRFFWSDWLSDAGLRRSSLAARGLWMDMLCIAAQHDPIGYLAIKKVAIPTADIARMVGSAESEVQTLIEELERNGVLSRDRNGTIYSRRMVRDYKTSQTNKKNGKLGGNPTIGNNKRKSRPVNPPDNPEVKPLFPLPSPKERKMAAEAAHPPTEEAQLYARAREILGSESGGLMTLLVRNKGGNIALARAALEMASTKAHPKEYIGAIIRGRDSKEDLRARGEAW